jgi:AraC-like DNA-binding protein
MSEYDRLSSLINRFSLKVTPLYDSQANLVIMQNRENGEPTRILLAPLNSLPTLNQSDECIMFSARTEWGGRDNPLFTTLPDLIEMDLHNDPNLSMLVQLLKTEAEAQRCGVSGAINRLGEVLMIHILRRQIEIGSTETGLLGGLADSRLSRAIVSMHEAPGKNWKNADLAEIAGLSISRFAELFQQRVGETPQSYLRRWRMILAHQDVQRGDRIQSIAARYGYASSEALSRAFQRQFGNNPVSLRKSS